MNSNQHNIAVAPELDARSEGTCTRLACGGADRCQSFKSSHAAFQVMEICYEQFVRVSMLPAKFNDSPNLIIKSPLTCEICHEQFFCSTMAIASRLTAVLPG